MPPTWGQECKSRPGQWPRLGTEPADTRIHLHQRMLSTERKKKKRKKLKRRRKNPSKQQYGNMAKFAWKIERWWSKDRCITPADTRQLWKKVFCSEEAEKKLLRLCPKRRAGRCLFNQSHFQGNSVNTVHNVLFPQFEFPLPTLANNCQKHFLTNRIFKGRVLTVDV